MTSPRLPGLARTALLRALVLSGVASGALDPRAAGPTSTPRRVGPRLPDEPSPLPDAPRAALPSKSSRRARRRARGRAAGEREP